MVQIKLTKQQLNKLHKGQAFQMSYKQIVNGEGAYDVDIDVDRKLHNKIHRNVSNGKGFRIPKGLMNVGSKLAKQAASKAADYAVAEGSKRLNQAITDSSYVPDSVKGDLVNLSNRGVSSVKTAGLNYVNNKLDPVNGEGFGDFVKGLKKVGKVLAPVGKTLVKVGAPILAERFVPGSGQVVGSLTSGLGVRRFRKGSPEAREHMARIRAMRGSKGKGFKSMMSKAGKAAVAVGRVAAPIVKDIAIREGTKALNNYIAGSQQQQGQGFSSVMKKAGRSALSAAKVAAPVLLKAGAPIARDMAVNALNSYMSGEGIYKPGFSHAKYRSGIRLQPQFVGNSSVAAQGKIINNRDTSNEARTLINGIDTVGAGFSSWGYA